MGKLIDKKAETLYVLLDKNGNSIITPEQQKVIDNFKVETIKAECPACDGDGHIEGQYCDVCRGKRTFTYHTELKIVPLTQDELNILELNQLKGAAKTEFIKKNKIQFFEGTELDWNKIPSEIKTIAVDSRGKVFFYSSVSGIYNRYDDEHTENIKHRGGQYWYYGSSLPNLDITLKYPSLKIASEYSNKIFYRPDAKKVILDFKKEIDWRYFPENCTKLFITFGGMNNVSQEIHIVVGSDEMYLRNDNVVWGYGGRTEVDECFDINLCAYYINDGTNEYPHFKSKKEIGTNEMNFHLKNIPYKTVIYELPKDRSKKLKISELKKLDIELCKKINSRKRLIKEHLTLGKFKASEVTITN